MGPTREPLLTNGSIIALVTALLALFVSFGVDLDESKQTAILGVTAAVVPLILAAVTRGQVTPVAAPRSNTGRRLIPVPSEQTVEPGHDLHSDAGLGVVGLILIVLAVIGVLALLGYGVGL